ncbi:MAG: hypothetical protein GMKNLPBB_02303 [Myxococcota bacterium]|nr:hypothetical protein [Myxococcota bacterium]
MYQQLLDIDHQLFRLINSVLGALAGGPLHIIGHYGVNASAFLLLAWVLWKKRGKEWLGLLVFCVISYVLVLYSVDLLKQFFARPRPLTVYADAVVVGDRLGSKSFPSGHSANAAAAAMAAILLDRRLLWGAVAFAFTGGLSRITSGVHYPADVAAGWLLGAACILGLFRLWAFAPQSLKFTGIPASESNRESEAVAANPDRSADVQRIGEHPEDHPRDS